MFGVTPTKLLMCLRLARAPGLLRKYRRVRAASKSLKFKQVSHFSREFKALYGVPPSVVARADDAQARVAVKLRVGTEALARLLALAAGPRGPRGGAPRRGPSRRRRKDTAG